MANCMLIKIELIRVTFYLGKQIFSICLDLFEQFYLISECVKRYFVCDHFMLLVFIKISTKKTIFDQETVKTSKY